MKQWYVETNHRSEGPFPSKQAAEEFVNNYKKVLPGNEATIISSDSTVRWYVEVPGRTAGPFVTKAKAEKFAADMLRDHAWHCPVRSNEVVLSPADIALEEAFNDKPVYGPVPRLYQVAGFLIDLDKVMYLEYNKTKDRAWIVTSGSTWNTSGEFFNNAPWIDSLEELRKFESDWSAYCNDEAVISRSANKPEII